MSEGLMLKNNFSLERRFKIKINPGPPPEYHCVSLIQGGHAHQLYCAPGVIKQKKIFCLCIYSMCLSIERVFFK